MKKDADVRCDKLIHLLGLYSSLPHVVAFSTRVADLLLICKKGSLILAIEKMVLPRHLFTGL
jgi:hypothetical protein